MAALHPACVHAAPPASDAMAGLQPGGNSEQLRMHVDAWKAEVEWIAARLVLVRAELCERLDRLHSFEGSSPARAESLHGSARMRLPSDASDLERARACVHAATANGHVITLSSTHVVCGRCERRASIAAVASVRKLAYAPCQGEGRASRATAAALERFHLQADASGGFACTACGRASSSIADFRRRPVCAGPLSRAYRSRPRGSLARAGVLPGQTRLPF